MRFITIKVQKGKIHIVQDGPLPVANGVITPRVKKETVAQL